MYVNDKLIDEGHVNLGVADNRGRAVGIAWVIYEVPDEGFYYGRTHITRNGLTYGAVQRAFRAGSYDDVRQLLDAKLARISKANIRKWGKVVVLDPANPAEIHSTLKTILGE